MKKLTLIIFLIVTLLCGNTAFAKSFVVKNIEIQGLQRISSATVYNYLPIKRGQTITSQKTGEIIRALYKTGFFEHISLSQSGNTLIIHVEERATIGQLTIKGNSLIPTDKLTTVMKSVDIAEGRIYNSAMLERIKQSLLNQYYQAGRYNARVDVIVNDMPRNRKQVFINISEGTPARIQHISIIGNKSFSSRKLIKALTISTPGLLTWYSQTDQYSQERMQSSVEALRNYYLDRGFIKVDVKQPQVSITPSRKVVYVTFVIDEGERYRVKGYKLNGDFPVPKEELEKLVLLKKGDYFSRKDVIDTEKAMSNALGDKGYVYATISINPTIDERNKTVFIDFQIKPGKRTYVRHIFFSDNTKTNDVVLRREVQQMEGGLVSTSQLEESKRRINILPFMRDVEMNLVPVADQDDQVDVNYKVTEQSSAELTGRIGYSQLEKFLIGAGVNQKNFLGTGKTLGLNAQTSKFQDYYGFSYSDPYFLSNGIGRSLSLSYTKYDPKAANLSHSYTQNEFDFADMYAIPIGQEVGVINRFEFGYGYQNTLINIPNNATNVSNIVRDFVNKHGRHFQQILLLAQLSRDSRDKAIFPTRGARQALGASLYIPIAGSDLKYYMFNYSGAWFHPLVNDYLLTARGNFGYGNSFSNGNNYPFFKNFYAGGIESVRGFSGNTLGPRDNLNNPTGGNLLASVSGGLILPNFISENVRTTVFVDAGNVWQTYDNRVFGGTASGPVRLSTGVQLEWLSMMGPIEVSLARGFNGKHNNYEAFQFSLGANFG